MPLNAYFTQRLRIQTLIEAGSSFFSPPILATNQQTFQEIPTSDKDRSLKSNHYKLDQVIHSGSSYKISNQGFVPRSNSKPKSQTSKQAKSDSEIVARHLSPVWQRLFFAGDKLTHFNLFCPLHL